MWQEDLEHRQAEKITCNPKDKSKWTIIGYAGKRKTIECSVCHAQWDTAVKYVDELQKASYLK